MRALTVLLVVPLVMLPLYAVSPTVADMSAPLLTGSLAQIRDRHSSVKWVAFAPDVLPVWVAEMDALPCPAVVEAVSAAMSRGDTGYGWGPPYAAAVADFAADRWAWTPEPARMVVVADVMIGIAEVLRQVTPGGGSVVVSPPCYDSFFGFTQAIGRRLVEAPLVDDRLNADALDRAFGEARAGGEPAAYLLCNPQNPTGTVHTAAELSELARIAHAHGVTVVADEIHAPLVYPGGAPFTPYLSVPGGERGIAVFSPSKGWNLAGLKSAAVIFGEDAAAIQAGFHDVHTHGASHVAMQAHIAALRDGRDWLDQVLLELSTNRQVLGAALATALPEIGYAAPAATYLAWLDCRTLGLGDDPAAVFRDRGRVALSSGPAYGATAGAGFARFNFATSPEVIQDAVSRMASAL